MKAYCLDTSGLSNPLETMPEDIHRSLWRRVAAIIESGRMAATAEIYDELTHLEGPIGDCIRVNKAQILLEVGQGNWDWMGYIGHGARMQVDHHDFIAEYTGNRKRTVGLNDITIVALAKTLTLPVISMEAATDAGPSRRRIPHVCVVEGVEHLTFNDFLRREGIAI
jgi:hypothetical protein